MKYLRKFNEMVNDTSDIQQIGNDIFLSGDINDLPKNTLIVKNFYNKNVGNVLLKQGGGVGV